MLASRQRTALLRPQSMLVRAAMPPPPAAIPRASSQNRILSCLGWWRTASRSRRTSASQRVAQTTIARVGAGRRLSPPTTTSLVGSETRLDLVQAMSGTRERVSSHRQCRRHTSCPESPPSLQTSPVSLSRRFLTSLARGDSIRLRTCQRPTGRRLMCQESTPCKASALLLVRPLCMSGTCHCRPTGQRFFGGALVVMLTLMQPHQVQAQVMACV